MTTASYVLGALNVVVMTISLLGYWKLACAAYVLAQIPWTIYDIATHQYGFLINSAGTLVSVAVTVQVKWKHD